MEEDVRIIMSLPYSYAKRMSGHFLLSIFQEFELEAS